MPRFQDAIPGDPQRAWQRRPNTVFINPLHLAPESTLSTRWTSLEGVWATGERHCAHRRCVGAAPKTGRKRRHRDDERRLVAGNEQRWSLSIWTFRQRGGGVSRSVDSVVTVIDIGVVAVCHPGRQSYDRYSGGTCRLFAGFVSCLDIRVTSSPPTRGRKSASSASAASFA